MPSPDLLDVHHIRTMGKLTEPGAALLRPLMPPAVASMRFNRSILNMYSQQAFVILPW